MQIRSNTKRLLAVLTAAFCTLTSAAVSVPAALVSAADGPDILIMGDSISAGYALAEGELGYYTYLADTLNGTVTNLAVSGDTTADLLSVIADASNAEAIANADLICISIGGNDLLQPTLEYFRSLQEEGEGLTATLIRLAQEGTIESHMSALTGLLKEPRETAQANLAQIETNLRALNADAQIVMQSLYNPLEVESTVYNGTDYSSQYTYLMNYVNGQLRRVNNTISGLETVTYADVYTAFHETGWLYVRTLEKDVHPTALGHALIAAVILDAAYPDTVLSSEDFNAVLDGLTEAVSAAVPEDDRALLERYTVKSAVFGDVDGSGDIMPVDALQTLIAAADIMSKLEPKLTEQQLLVADVDGDGGVTVLDAQYILIYYANTASKLECTWQGLTHNPNAPTYSNLG